MTTPNRAPLWEVMEQSCGTVANWDDVIRAVRDWLETTATLEQQRGGQQ